MLAEVTEVHVRSLANSRVIQALMSAVCLENH